MFQTKFVVKIKTHVLCSVTFFENRAFYQKLWKNIAVRGKSRIVCPTRTACWIRYEYTHLGCVILIDFPLQQWLHESARILHCTYIDCLL